MYVCICHAVSDRELRRKAEEGSTPSAAHYFRSRGVRPRCGKCVGDIHALLKADGGCRADMRGEAEHAAG
jgi:bacterioferritin-associated ferredoxin